MATVVNHTVKSIYCNCVSQDVALIEERIYPSEMLPDTAGAQFWIRARKCDLGIDCNIAGYACKWSGLNPNYDPFAMQG